jgi:excinuclease UvrABC nuclease subunit
MPFSEHFPRSFTTSSIREHAPALSGIYGISNAAEWIYIGEADNIREALLGHLQDSGTALLARRPTGFVFELCQREQRHSRQDRLILEYEPTCNRHWSRHA